MSVSKSCFYNNRLSHPEADKTLTDAIFSYQYYCSSYQYYCSSSDHRIKKSRSAGKNDKAKKIIIGQKSGPAKTIFGQKSGPAMAGPAVPPTTALTATYHNAPQNQSTWCPQHNNLRITTKWCLSIITRC